MNNEQLENSLRDEIDNYFRTAFAQIQDDIAELQSFVDTEIKKQQALIDEEIKKHQVSVEEKFAELHAQTGEKSKLESSFMRVVLEHLRVAREEGEQSAAKELTAAAAMPVPVAEPAGPSVSFSEIRDAVQNISEQTSQSEILKSLVNHASKFAARGAFFIVKSDKLVGWRKFGKELEGTDDSMKGVTLSLYSDTLVSRAIQNSALQATEGDFSSEDGELSEKLEFSPAEKAVAIPLVVRGRSVAVLYADSGTDNTPTESDALEILMRVAGLTVELMASAKSGAPKAAPAVVAPVAAPATSSAPTEETSEPLPSEKYVAPSYTTSDKDEESASKTEETDSSAEETASYTEESAQTSSSFEPVNSDFDNAPIRKETFGEETEESEPVSVSEEEVAEEEAVKYTEESVAEEESYAPATSDSNDFGSSSGSFSFSPPNPYREAVEREEVAEQEEFAVATMEEQQPAVDEAAETLSPVSTGYQEFDVTSFTPTDYATSPAVQEEPVVPQVETPVAVSAPPVAEQTPAPSLRRFGGANTDLPIEVPEEERRIHNDARRFARLLVSEIKLYNEAKVKEGRQEGDLYDRLREAIDRSREMYDKRVSEAVAAKFDYFHYELVNTLAEGDENKLGRDYKN